MEEQLSSSNATVLTTQGSTIYQLPRTRDGLIIRHKEEIESLKVQLVVQQKQIRKLQTTNDILEQTLCALRSDPKRLKVMLGICDLSKSERGRKLGEVRPIVKEFILPYCKFQSDCDLFDFGPNTIGETIMNQLGLEDDLEVRSNYWCSVYLLVKGLMKEHRQYVARIIRNIIVGGK